jgi:hypothetical protein
MKFITLLKNPSISRLALCLILFFGIADGISKGVTSYQAQTTATHASGAASALSLSFPSNTVAGDVILVGFDFDKNASLSSLSDAQGNTFTEVGTPLMSPGGAQSRVYYARNIRGGADTVTVKLTANSAYIEVYLSEYLGMNKTSPVDAQAGAVGSAGNVSSGLATTTVGDVIYGFSVGDGASTVGSSFTARSTMNGNLVEDKITGFTGPHDATAIANSGWTMQMVSLKPASTNPVANLSATSLNFAGQAVGTTSGVQKTTLTNSGNAALIITSIAVSGANAGDFTQTNNCGSSLAAAANCAISVTFKPAATGTRTAAVILTDNATGGTQSVILTGAGTSTTTANVSPSGLIFANQTLGATSAAQIATLTNSGTAALGITSIALSGANASDFKQSNNCSSNVAAGAKCTISFTFTPSASGTRVALLTIIDTAPGSPQTVSLSGTGAGPTPTVSVTPSSLSFGSQCVAMTSTVQTVSVKNTGTSTLNVTKLAVTGVNASEFAQTSTCGASVAAGASCTIAVLFTPSATGARAAALSISDNASGGSQTVSLSGSGSHNVMVSWDDSTSSGVVGYYVYRGTTSGAEGSTPVNGTLTNCNSYMDENVTAGAKYYYTVKSLGADGVTRSAASSETQATVPTL